jgi:hypothetical protein
LERLTLLRDAAPLPEHSLEAHGWNVVALVDLDVPVISDEITDFVLPGRLVEIERQEPASVVV